MAFLSVITLLPAIFLQRYDVGPDSQGSDALAAFETARLRRSAQFWAAKIGLDPAQQMQAGNAKVLLLLTVQQTYLHAVISVPVA